MLRRLLPPLAVTAALVVPATAAAAPTVGPTIPLSTMPSHVVGAPDGSAWVSSSDAAGQDVLHVAVDGTVTPFDLPGNGTVGITFGPDGALWATQAGGVLRFTPTSPPDAQAFGVADITDPRGIVTGPDGNLWTGSGGKLIRITTAGVPTSFPTGEAAARDIAATATGTVLADLGGNLIRATMAGAVTTTPVGAGAQGVAVAPSGQIAVSSSQTDPNRVTLLGPDHVVPALGDPFGITFAEDGAFWVARFAGDALDRIAPDGTSTTVALGAGSGPRQLAAAPGGRLWVVADIAKTIRRIDGVVAPLPAQQPVGPAPITLPAPVPSLPAMPFTLSARRTPPRRGEAAVKIKTSLPATARLTLQRERRGRRNRKGTCVQSSRAPSGAGCLRRLLDVRTRTVQLTGTGKARRVTFTSVSTPGTYRVRVVARNGGRVRIKTVKTVRVLPRPKRS